MKRFLIVLGLTFALGALTATTASADAQCMDGTFSAGDGSGTCSFHGGVLQWLPNGAVNTPVGQPTILPPAGFQPSPFLPPKKPKEPWVKKNWWVLAIGAFVVGVILNESQK